MERRADRDFTLKPIKLQYEMQPRLEKPITQQSLQGDLSLWGSLWYGMIRYAGEKDCKGNGKLRGLGSVIFGNETTKSCTPHQPAHLRFCSSSVKSPNRMKLRASGRPSIVSKSRPHPSASSSSLLLLFTLAPHETCLFTLLPSFAFFSGPLPRPFLTPSIYTSHLPCPTSRYLTVSFHHLPCCRPSAVTSA